MSEPVRSFDRITIPAPCDADWDSMIGNEQVRFCEHCNLHVTNLSSLTRLEATRFVARSQGRLCVRYVEMKSRDVLIRSTEKLHRIGRRVSHFAAGAFTATLSLSSAAAQTGSAAIPEPLQRTSATTPENQVGTNLSGVVTDPNRAVVPGAVVTLTNAKTQMAFIYSTDEDGSYKFSLLEPGKYSLKVEAPTFAKPELPDVELGANANRTLDVELQLPPIVAQVEVNANNTEIQVTATMGVVAFVEPEDPLVKAVFKDDVDAVRQLVFSSLDLNVRDKASGMTALEHATENGNVEIARTLVLAGARAEVKDDSGRTALMYLGEKATTDLVRELLSAGARVNARDDSGGTALMNAASRSTYAVVKELIDNGAKVDLKDSDRKTALMFAASNDDPLVTKLLVDAGATIDAKDNDGRTALMIAADEGDPETVRLLISYGAEINERDKDGWSALMFAASVKDEKSVTALLNAGADLTFKDKDGKTVLALARQNGQEEIVKLLESRGAPE
jgi:ankyrin repeat protein